MYRDPEDVDIERTEWNPNEEQIDRYREAEVRTARSNIALLRARARSSPGAKFATADTLHSRPVLWTAMQGAAS